jgi:putative transposase
MGLNLPRQKKRRLPDHPQQPLDAPHVINKTWSINFMSHVLYSGKRFHTLNVTDDGVREMLRIIIDTSLPASRVVRTLEQIAAWRGLPSALRLDNGPELISQVLVDWCKQNNLQLRYIQPGKPNQNAFIERFNKTYRVEVLNAYLFRSLDHVREITDGWLRIYYKERPH